MAQGGHWAWDEPPITRALAVPAPTVVAVFALSLNSFFQLQMSNLASKGGV